MLGPLWGTQLGASRTREGAGGWWSGPRSALPQPEGEGGGSGKISTGRGHGSHGGGGGALPVPVSSLIGLFSSRRV